MVSSIRNWQADVEDTLWLVDGKATVLVSSKETSPPTRPGHGLEIVFLLSEEVIWTRYLGLVRLPCDKHPSFTLAEVC